MGIWTTFRRLQTEGSLNVSGSVSAVLNVAATGALMLALSLALYAENSGDTRFALFWALGLIAFCAFAIVALTFLESPKWRLLFALFLMRRARSRLSARDLVALSRLTCWGSRHESIRWGMPCCSSSEGYCVEPSRVLIDALADERLRSALARTLTGIMPAGGELDVAFRAGMWRISDGRIGSLGSQCCVGHRFPGLDVPVDFLAGAARDAGSVSAPALFKMLLAERYVAVGPWWEGSAEAALFSRILRDMAEAPEHVLRTADLLVSIWSQEPESLIPASRRVSGA